MAKDPRKNDPGASQHRQRDEEQRFKKQREARAWLERVGEDIAVTEPPKPSEVIPEILPCASTIVAGAGHEGKSVTLIFIAIRIALGLKIFGRDAREGPVLYAFGEDSTTDVRRLVHLITRRSYPEQNMSKRLNERLHLLNVSRVPSNPKLLRELNGAWQPAEWFDQVEHIVTGRGYSAIILDTLSSLGLPESMGMNDAAAAYHLAANRIAETHDLAFIGSHHVGQNAAKAREIGMYSARGATAITDNARCVIQLQRHEAGDPYACPFDIEGKYVTRLHVVKHKWSRLTIETPLWIEGEHYQCTDHAELTGPRLADAKRQAYQQRQDAKIEQAFERIEDAIDVCQKRRLELTKGNIATFADGLGVNRANRTVNQMVAAGRLVIEEKKSDGPGRPPEIFRRKRFGED